MSIIIVLSSLYTLSLYGFNIMPLRTTNKAYEAILNLPELPPVTHHTSRRINSPRQLLKLVSLILFLVCSVNWLTTRPEASTILLVTSKSLKDSLITVLSGPCTPEYLAIEGHYGGTLYADRSRERCNSTWV